MDDVPVLEIYSSQSAADLGAELNLLDRGKLTQEAQSGINLARERLAHHDLWKSRSGGGDRGITLPIQIGQRSGRDDCDTYTGSDQQPGCRPSDSTQILLSGLQSVAEEYVRHGSSSLGTVNNTASSHVPPGARTCRCEEAACSRIEDAARQRLVFDDA